MAGLLYVTVIINCKANQITACLQGALKTRKFTLEEDGCIEFLITQSTEDPQKIFFHEAYINQEAFEFHQEQKYMQEFGSIVEEEYAHSIQFYMSQEIT
jgi:quinol monooxygenase YgiN